MPSATYHEDNSTPHTCDGTIEEAAGAVNLAVTTIREVWNPPGNDTIYAAYSSSAPASTDYMRPIAAGASYCQNRVTGVAKEKLYVKGTNTQKLLYIEG